VDSGKFQKRTLRVSAANLTERLGPRELIGQVPAAVIRGAVADTLRAQALRRVNIPVLVRNGKGDVAHHEIAGLLEEIPNAATPSVQAISKPALYQPTFQHALVDFFNNRGDSTAL
jgi:hypothetical protein